MVYACLQPEKTMAMTCINQLNLFQTRRILMHININEGYMDFRYGAEARSTCTRSVVVAPWWPTATLRLPPPSFQLLVLLPMLPKWKIFIQPLSWCYMRCGCLYAIRLSVYRWESANFKAYGLNVWIQAKWYAHRRKHTLAHTYTRTHARTYTHTG